MVSYGAVCISRNDGYGGDLESKFLYSLSSLIDNLDEVYYIDWNSPDDKPLIDLIKGRLPKTGKLHSIVISNYDAATLTNFDENAQKCCEVLARNIGIRRLSTDFIISTNSDIMCISREDIENYAKDDLTFYTCARMDTDFPFIRDQGFAPGSQELFDYIKNNKQSTWGQHQAGSPLGPNDKWSLISCPGDFQIAHRNVWNGIRGFEESLIYRGYTDTNVQVKANFYGYRQQLVMHPLAYHFRHYPDTGSTGGAFGIWNDDQKAIWQFNGTENKEDWGFANLTFEEEII